MSLELKSNNHQNNLKEVKPHNSVIYEFEDFRLDTAHLMLSRNGEEISLTPKVVETLLALVERSGEIVSKDELMDRLWANAFVEESNLVQNIYVLRKTLGETTGGKPLIETLRRRGYRFNGELKENKHAQLPLAKAGTNDATEDVSEFPSGISNKSIAEKASAVIASSFSRPIAAFALLALLVGAIGLGYYFLYAGNLAVGDKKSIAVLPLKPINTANRDEIYEVGIADSLIHRFSSMKGFVVRPLSATRKYADIAQDPLAAGREQQVDYVLASNYQLAGGKIKVTAQLINVASGQIEETYKSEKDAGDVFAMQDAIAGEVGNILLARFVTTSSSLTAKRGTINEEAYRLYLQAMYLYDKRTPADARKAVELLEQAIQLDSNFARAWAGKAHAHRALGNFGGNTHEEYKKSIEAINKALALDENLADAHSALCENKYFYELDFDGAELECKRAIELDPHSSLAHQIYSRNLLPLGRFDESIAEIKIAIDLEPTSLFSQRNFGVSFYYARRFDEAASQFKRVIEMDPNFVAPYPFLINTLTLQGNEAEAFEWFLKWLAVQKTDDETVQIFKTAYQTSGWQGVGRERVKRFDESKIRTYFMEACMAAQAGDKDKALEYLEKSSQRREWGMGYLRIDPSLDVLRGDPRFDELVKRVGLK